MIEFVDINWGTTTSSTVAVVRCIVHYFGGEIARLGYLRGTDLGLGLAGQIERVNGRTDVEIVNLPATRTAITTTTWEKTRGRTDTGEPYDDEERRGEARGSRRAAA